ncbi:kinase-like domain-containing protein [Xylaria longipes]|nr:kinase-like domain-containing protein [Xylaria longipes]
MTLRKELKDAKEECPLTKQNHIRPDIIRNIITAESVKDELPPTWGRWLIPCWDWELEDKVQRASKVIAILVLLGRYDSIDALLKDGLVDDHLPLVKDGNCLRSQCGKKSFESFNTCRGYRDLADMFLETQWVVWAPILDFKAGNLTPIRLQPSSTLPFDYEVVATTTYSAVYKGTLWPSHYKGIKDKPHGKFCIAIKQFKDGPKADKNRHYREELANLKLIQMIEDEHLSKPLACCEQARSIFFPWAGGGDLWDFWEANGPQELKRTLDVFLWALRQITGLTHALELIHQAKTRHGDLKPSNILHFTDGNTKLGTLKIADFGVSRTHKIETGLRKNPTITKASTFIYEAPEAHDSFKNLQSRSRKYDCWSMGCIMLEFVIWLLYDCKAISSCLIKRDPPDHAYYRPIAGPDPRNQAIEDAMEVHPVVNKAVREMENHIWFENTAVEAIVKLVKSGLLKIKPEERLGAGDTHKALQAILATAQKDLSPFTKEVDPALPVPPIFSQPAPKVSIQATYEQR